MAWLSASRSVACGVRSGPLPAVVLFQAKESGNQVNVVIDKEDVLAKIGDLLKRQDLSRYVL